MQLEASIGESGEAGRAAAGSSQNQDQKDMSSDFGKLQMPHPGFDVLFCYKWRELACF